MNLQDLLDNKVKNGTKLQLHIGPTGFQENHLFSAEHLV